MKNGELAVKVVEQADRIRLLERELKTCANELCLRCGEYKQEHLGACNGCRWLSARHGGMPT